MDEKQEAQGHLTEVNEILEKLTAQMKDERYGSAVRQGQKLQNAVLNLTVALKFLAEADAEEYEE